MLEDLRIWIFNKKTWINTLIYIVYSIILLLFILIIDSDRWGIKEYVPGFMMTELGLARSVLSVIAGALLSITTFTFSTIMAVLIMYSAAFSPRTIENFVKMDITMKVLGIFIGGFFYCIIALAFMNPEHVGDHVFAGTAGAIYSLACIIYFVVFVQKVIYSIQDVNLVLDIYDDTKPIIDEEVQKRMSTPEYLADDGDFSREIRSNKIGYLGSIDYKGLHSALKGEEGLFRIKAKIGDFLVEDSVIGYLSVKNSDVSAKTVEEIKESFIFQESKVMIRDYRYGLIKLSEVAVKAFSAGINDPNTGVHCIRKMSALLAELSKTNLQNISVVTKNACKIQYESHPFREDLYESFHQVILYGKEDPSVTRAMMEGLFYIKQKATKENAAHVDEFATSLYNQAIKTYTSGLDKEHVFQAYNKIVPED